MSEDLLRHLDDRGIHRVIMDHGANALDEGLLAALSERIGTLVAVGAPPLLLASSHPTVFCPGWDLKELVGADRDRVASVLGAFNDLILDLFSYPGPTAVAITGHAVAGGCLLAMAADLRVMATGQPRLGFAELNLGLPVPAACIRMLRSRSLIVDEVMLGGEGCTAERAFQLGLVQQALPVERVTAVADRELRKLGSKPAPAYAATKAFLHGPDWRAMATDYDEEDRQFLELWFTDETQRRIREVVRGLGE
jgi:enoyl-CoA hydratase